MVRVSTENPWRLPWVFRYAGLLRGTAFVADLGPRQNFPHAKIAAYKLSSQVTSYFELGVAVLVQEGGRGAPRASFKDRLFDFVPVLKYTLPDHAEQFSNKFAGFESRFRIPMLHNMQLYTEHYFDDMDPRRWRSTLWEDGGHLAGVSLAQLGPQGALSATAEFHHTGLRYYRHATFASGVTFNRTLLGDPLGPQGDGANIALRFNRGGVHNVQLNAAVERRGGDVWNAISTKPFEADFHFVLVEGRPAEWRHRLGLQWSLAVPHGQRVTVQGGVERVRDADFLAGRTRVNSLGNVQWSWFAW
jgi:hypothetical protein